MIKIKKFFFISILFFSFNSSYSKIGIDYYIDLEEKIGEKSDLLFEINQVIVECEKSVIVLLIKVLEKLYLVKEESELKKDVKLEEEKMEGLAENNLVKKVIDRCGETKIDIETLGLIIEVLKQVNEE